MKINSKLNFLFVIGLFLLMILGCQEEAGRLVALPHEGVEIKTVKFENDTAEINRNGLVIKFNGDWEGSVGINLTVKNLSSSEAVLKFGEMQLVSGENSRSTIGGIVETTDGIFTHIREARVNGKENEEKPPDVKISSDGKERRFLIAFSQTFSSAKDEEIERTLYFTLPVELKNASQNSIRFESVFRAVEWANSQ